MLTHKRNANSIPLLACLCCNEKVVVCFSHGAGQDITCDGAALAVLVELTSLFPVDGSDCAPASAPFCTGPPA